MTEVANGWTLYQYTLFRKQLTKLKEDVIALRHSDPDGYKKHPKTKFLASIYKAITKSVPANPNDPSFRLGHTLGKHNTHWRRVKKGMPQRYRLFYRFSSDHNKIVYVWFNDENTLRKIGDKSDVYAVFKKMLERGDVPETLEQLLKDSET